MTAFTNAVTVCSGLSSMLALALIVYIGLTVLLVGAVQSQPPV